MRSLPLAVLAFVLATGAHAGALLSATFTTSSRYAPIGTTAPVSIASTTATGALTGSIFSLDAGGWFQLNTLLPQTGQPPAVGVSVVVAQNGALTGSLGDTTFGPPTSAPAGVVGALRIKAKVGGGAPFTALQIPFNAGAGTTLLTSNPASGLMASVMGGRWQLAPVTFASTFMFLPAGTRQLSGGGVSVTPGGNTQITLVSLSRVKVRGLANYSMGLFQSLRLVYAPEPDRALLAAVAVSVCALAALRRHRTRERRA